MKNYLRAAALWLRTSFSASPGLTVIMCLTSVLAGIVIPLSLLGVSQLIQAVINHTSLWPGLILIGGCLLIASIAGGLSGPLGETVEDRLTRHIHAETMTMVASIPGLAHYESAEVADRIKLVRQDIYQLGHLSRLLSAIVGVTAVVTSVALLWSVHPLTVFLLVAAMVPTGMDAYGNGRLIKLNRKNVHFYRTAQSLIEVLNRPEQGLEVRAFGMRSPLLEMIKSAVLAVLVPNARLMTRIGMITATLWIAYATLYFGAVWWVVGRAQTGLATVAAVALLILLGPQVNSTARTVTSSVDMVTRSVLAFDRYRWLRDYAGAHQWDGATKPVPARLQHGLTLRDVDFSYPSSQGDKTALAGVNLTIPAGTAVALVGENGAGKSTLVKLVARFYDPTAGQVLVDGVPLTEIDPRQWRARMSAGFQDFVKLAFTAGEAIAVGQVDQRDDQQLVDHAARAGHGNEVIAELRDGYATQLGSQFDDGVDLSGGQWQRLALSRVFMRQHPLVMLLDEPTSALDPEAEHAIYDEYAAAAQRHGRETGAITILVSHRFSTVRMADLIVVLSDGGVSEVGTHAELMAKGGQYAEMFELQARAYR